MSRVPSRAAALIAAAILLPSLTAASCGNKISFSYHFHFLVGQIVPHSDITLSTTACNQA